MADQCREIGKMSNKPGFTYAEGWKRHLHIGFSLREIDPLSKELGKFAVIDKEYERELDIPK